MKRHTPLTTLLIIFFLFSSINSVCSAEENSGKPDIIIKISRLNQAINAIDKMAGTDIDDPTSSPSYILRSILFGTDWIDPNRAIVIGMNFNKMQVDATPTMTALIPFIRRNEDFHLSYNAVSKIDHYLVPLPPGQELTITDQMHYDLADAAKTKPKGIISIELASSQLLKKADQQVQNMLMEIDSKIEDSKNSATSLTSEDLRLLFKNLIDAAKQLETLSIGMDITDSNLIIFSDALAHKRTDLSKLFTRKPSSKFSRLINYTPKHHINFKSTSYNLKGMLSFFNKNFGGFYKKIGIDLDNIEIMASHFTGEMAGGISFNDTGMDIEMIAILNDPEKIGTEFLKSVYLPQVLDYGQQMASFYSEQIPGAKVKNFFSATPESSVNGNKVYGINCEIPLTSQGMVTKEKFKFHLRTTMIDKYLLTASSDEQLKKMIKTAATLEKKPYKGPLMKMDIDMGAYLSAVQKILSQTGTSEAIDFPDVGTIEYTLDMAKNKLSNKYVIGIDDIRKMVSTFKQAGTSSMDAETDSTYTSGQSFSYSAPTMLQHSGKKQTPKPQKEDSAEFWLDKGLLYATYGNDKEAIKFYQKSLQIEPDNTRTLFNIGLSYSSLGNYDMAINALSQALSLAPDNGDYHYGIGWVYLLKGESGKAMDFIRTAADLGNPDAQKYLLKNQ